jgi:hypothetical protein
MFFLLLVNVVLAVGGAVAFGVSLVLAVAVHVVLAVAVAVSVVDCCC